MTNISCFYSILLLQEIIDVRSMLTDAIRGASSDIMTHTSNSDRLVKPLGKHLV